MKTKFVEYKTGEPWSCLDCCHYAEASTSDESCESKGWFCAQDTRKDKKSGYFVEIKENNVKTKPKPTSKNTAVVPAQQKKPTIADMVGKFIAIEAFGASEEFNVNESDILGIFDTEKLAIDHICEDAKENFEADNEATIKDGEDWASNCLIVEIKRVVRPILTATVKCEVKDVVL